MTKPPTMAQAQTRGLLVKYPNGVDTFSNGSEWYSWAAGNCDDCRYYDPDVGGKLCAFEGAAVLRMVSPELARLFGWLEDAEYPGEFEAPEQCAFFREKGDDGDSRPPPPDPDPLQLVLIADPREDAALMRVVEVEVLAHV